MKDRAMKRLAVRALFVNTCTMRFVVLIGALTMPVGSASAATILTLTIGSFGPTDPLTPDQIVLDADGDGIIELSDFSLPGERFTVSGKFQEIIKAPDNAELRITDFRVTSDVATAGLRLDQTIFVESREFEGIPAPFTRVHLDGSYDDVIDSFVDLADTTLEGFVNTSVSVGVIDPARIENRDGPIPFGPGVTSLACAAVLGGKCEDVTMGPLSFEVTSLALRLDFSLAPFPDAVILPSSASIFATRTVPEPNALQLLGVGIAGLLVSAYRSRAQRADDDGRAL